MSGPVLLSRTGSGCWRVRQDGTAFPGLPAALAAVRTAWPDRADLQALAWALLRRSPGLPLASDTVKSFVTASARMPMEDVVVSHGWLGLNTSEHANTVWLDIDGPTWRERLIHAVAASLPAPAWISESERGAHLGWILRTPVGLTSTDLADDHRRARLLSVTLSYLRTALGADPCASHGGMTKNPFSSRWTTTVGPLDPVDLKDLLRPLEALAVAEGWKAPRWARRSTYNPSDSPRGTRLWDSLRFKAYATGEDSEAVLREWADELAQTLGSPAPEKQRAGMSGRVAHFMRTRWRYGRRTAPLSPAQLQARQAEAGRTVASARALSRDDALFAASARLQARGEVPSQEAIAAEANVSLRTVKRAWPKLWHRIVNKVPYAPPLSGSSSDPIPSALPSLPSEAPPGSVASSATQEFGIPVSVIPAALASPRLPRCLSLLVGQENPSSLLRLVGVGGGGADPRFLSRKDRAVLARYDRESWHREEARAGLRSYALALAYRRGRLYAERKAELGDLRTTVQNQGDFLCDGDPRANLATAAAATERLRLAVMGWASRLNAEDRAEARMKAALAEQDGKQSPRFRTTLDSMDLFLGVLSNRAA